MKLAAAVVLVLALAPQDKKAPKPKVDPRAVDAAIQKGSAFPESDPDVGGCLLIYDYPQNRPWMKDKDVVGAMDWIASHGSVEKNPEGATLLLARQKADGSWQHPASPHPIWDTSPPSTRCASQRKRACLFSAHTAS